MNIPGQFRPVELQIRANRFRPFPFSFINITQHRYKQGAIEFNVNRLIEDQDEHILAMAKKWITFVSLLWWSAYEVCWYRGCGYFDLCMHNVCPVFRQFDWSTSKGKNCDETGQEPPTCCDAPEGISKCWFHKEQTTRKMIQTCSRFLWPPPAKPS